MGLQKLPILKEKKEIELLGQVSAEQASSRADVFVILSSMSSAGTRPT